MKASRAQGAAASQGASQRCSALPARPMSQSQALAGSAPLAQPQLGAGARRAAANSRCLNRG